MSTIQTPSTGSKMNMRGILRSLVINAAFPVVLYLLSKQYVSSSDLVALSIAAVVPLLDSIVEVIGHRRLDIVGVLALLGIVVSIVGVLLGGDPKILLIRESFLTAALGIACFASLLLPRPLMFYFGRQFMAGNDPVKLAEFNATWQYPYARFVHRMITLGWGIAYVGEFILRVVMVYTLSAVVVLAISPFILGGLTLAAILLTFVYVRYAKRHGAEMRRQRQAMQTRQA